MNGSTPLQSHSLQAESLPRAPHHAAPGRSRSNRRRRHHARRQLAKFPSSVVLLLLAASTIYPLLFVVSIALKTPTEYATERVGIPAKPTLQAFADAWGQAQMGTYIGNTFIVTVAAVFLVVVLSTLAGYAIATVDFPLKGIGLAMTLALLALPGSLFIVPVFKVVLDLGLVNTYIGLVLVYASLQLPFGIFLMTSFFAGVPGELLDAAAIDGASAIRTLFSIAVPLARPATLTLTTLSFLLFWNELLFALVILQDPEKRMVQAGLSLLRNSLSINTSTATVAAGMTIAVIPPLLLFAIFNRQITTGLTAGAVK